MEWTKETTKKLIAHFRDKVILWDPKHVHFKDRYQKHIAWMELASHFDVNVDEVEKKMRKLIGQFQRELKKGKSGDGAEAQYKTRWAYFYLLFFLKDKNAPKIKQECGQEQTPGQQYKETTGRSQGSGFINESLENDDQTLADFDDDGCTSSAVITNNRDLLEPQCSSFSGSSPSLTFTHARKKIIKAEEEDRRQFVTASDVALEGKKNEENQNDAFGKFVARKLDRVADDMQRMFAETLINQAASYAIMGHLNEHSRIQLNKKLCGSETLSKSHDSYGLYHFGTDQTEKFPPIPPTTPPVLQGFPVDNLGKSRKGEK